ncbi:arabinofuranan 3-O-arabinosyltransferase [Dietzia cinnamea]|uniref:Arabinofuranan 3-O-arabinosyltransferase n=1 Tax=Dietzia cinnamea TaxID=321318 RepID=A0A4R3ZXN1_9ACTN|nr:arabinofuranan 3-O-arabinosyltransferase [Dietzia cinnamea]
MIRGARLGAGARDAVVAFLAFLLLACLQSPGLIAPDTKYDLVASPGRFLAQATHLWTGLSFAGQVQNQAYGYLFPQGPFFALFDLVGMPAWLTQRLWWAVVLTVAYVGVVRVAAALRIGTRVTRPVAGVLYALAPRMLGDLGSISSEIWPVALAPWVLLPVIRVLQGRMSPRRGGAGAALALALMGAVNAVATAVACLPAVLWWALHRPGRTWARLAAWWAPLSAAVCVWWAVPLVLLGRVSPPFLDYIESAEVTTRWASVTEVLRGAATWVPFVSTDRTAGADLTSEPAFVLATGVLAAAGVVGLLMRGMPARGRLLVIATVGLVAMSAAWVGPAGGGFAETVRALLDGAGAPLRNVHKFDPLLRLPLALGVAHLLTRLLGGLDRERAPGALAHPERDRAVAVAMIVVLAAGVSVAPAWLGRLAPVGSHEELPDHWPQAAAWLSENAPVDRPGTEDRDPAATTRALVVPGASFGRQVWGVTRDEPLQPLAETPWAVRDSVPLQPAPAIRALDAVQRRLADGRAAPGMAATLASLGIGYLVVRNDLSVDSAAPRPALVHQAVDGSPGLVKVAEFGEPVAARGDDVGAEVADGEGAGGDGDAGGARGGDGGDDDEVVVHDSGLRPAYPAIEIYRVDSRLGSDATPPGPPRSATAPYTVEVRDLPVVAGGPEALSRLDDLLAEQDTIGSPPRVTRLLEADALAAGVDPASDPFPRPRPLASTAPVLTDSPTDRETDFGRLDHNSSAVRAEGDPRRSRGAVLDYSASVSGDEPPRTRARWWDARVSVSSSAADSAQTGPVRPSHSVAAAVDGDPDTAWRSGGYGSAFGEWIAIDLPEPVDRAVLRLTVPAPAVGPQVTALEVRTDTGTTTVFPRADEETTVALPPGPTEQVRVTVTGVADGGRGTYFEVSEIGLAAGGEDIPLLRTIALPERADDARAPSGWLLRQELAGRTDCVHGGSPVEGLAGAEEATGAARCAPDLAIAPEEPGRFARLLDVPADTAVAPRLLVRPRPGSALDDVLRGDPASRARQVRAEGDSLVTDPAGAPSAAVDGDRSTSWHATDAPSPSLGLRLPGRHLVGSLRLWAPRSDAPAAPRVVTIDTGLQRTRVDLATLTPEEDGSVVVDLPADHTDRVTVRVDSTRDVRTPGGARVPAGIAEVWVQDASGARIGALPAADDDPVTLTCQDGPRLHIGDRVVRTRITASRRALLEGRAVPAELCDESPVPLPAGPQEVSVDPGEAFSVDTVGLVVVDGPGSTTGGEGAGSASAGAARVLGGAPQPTRAVTTVRWDDAHRELHVPAAPRERVLVVPESVSPAWRARLVADDGTALADPRAVTVDGWKQGWVLPAATTGATLVLTVPLDAPYRWALLTGPFALLLVLLLFLVRGHRDRAGTRATPWRGRGPVTVVATAAVGYLLAGPVGLAVTAGLTACALAASRHLGAAGARRLLVAGAGVGIVAGAALLARAPWPDPLGYAGDSLGPQVATVAGLVCAGLAASWPSAGRPRGARRGASQRWDGTSTSA